MDLEQILGETCLMNPGWLSQRALNTDGRRTGTNNTRDNLATGFKDHLHLISVSTGLRTNCGPQLHPQSVQSYMEFNLWDPPTPLTSLLGLIPSDPPLNTRESNTTASSSLLARRPILTRWEDPRPPTFGKRIRDVMRRLGSPSEAVLENPRFLAAIHQLCWEYVIWFHDYVVFDV